MLRWRNSDGTAMATLLVEGGLDCFTGELLSHVCYVDSSTYRLGSVVATHPC